MRQCSEERSWKYVGRGAATINRFAKRTLETIALGFFILLSGCSSLDYPVEKVVGHSDRSPENLAGSAEFYASLSSFGAPEVNYSIAVINFEDLTGARVEGGVSTAVSAAGKMLTELLLSSKELSPKFSVYSRSGLKDLITERSLAQAFEASRLEKLLKATPPELHSLVQEQMKPVFDLPDMRPADLLIYGAVVGYDKNLSDGGMGVGIAGGNAKQSRSTDQLYVILQLVETKTGRIRSVGSATELVDSTLTSSGYLGFISQFRILELEGGKAVNDPTTVALFNALQRAILEMFENA